ncbi:Hepatocyte growth factor-regulated tyrosine kinase substrate [Geodia barretti]|nr:Hepatocyte growth factor-regulated tyrosine kinase substrate [Geodia barretti]
MKNCATDVHKEILTQEFMGVMKSVITSSRDGRSDKAIDKALELIGEWKAAFGSRAGYKAVNEVFEELEKEGFFIPEPQVASASFIKPPPEWIIGDRCHMCRQEFNRLKGWFPHHCRNCGKSACTQCSTKRIPLPEFGIKQPTRVCDICYKAVAPDSASSSSTSDPKTKSEGASGASGGNLPEEYLRSSLAKETQVPAAPSDNMKMKEEDDLQLAIAMSLNEQDNKKKSSSSSSSSSKTQSSPASPPTSTAPSAPPPSTPSLYSSIAQEAADTAAASSTLYALPEDQPAVVQQQPPTSSSSNLAHYLDRGYWERKKEQQSGGGVAPQPQPGVVTVTPVSGGQPQSSGSPLADTVQSTVEQFVQQLRAVSGAGGSVAADPIVLSLYQTLNALHPQLLKQIDAIQQQKVHQEKVLHKINEAKTARAALNTMRREHQDRIRQQEEEQTLLARMQMEQKLALLRQQKQEQLMYQQSLQQKRLDNMQAKRQEYERQLALQRDQERQQLIAQEQQVIQRQLRDTSPVHMQMQVGPQPVVIPQFQPVAPPPASMEPSGAVGLSLQSLALHDPTLSAQAPPLPSKLDHNMSSDPRPLSLPPPYHPVPPTGPTFQTMPTIPQHAMYSDPSHAPPPGSHGDSSLWVNNSTSSLHPPAHLYPSPTSTPPQQRSPMTAPVQQSMGVAAGGAYPAHFQQVHDPSHQLTSLPPQQQLYQPPAANFATQPLDHVPTHTMLNQQQPLRGQQPMSMQQPLQMQGIAMAPPPPMPVGGVQRQESGPPLISFD